MVFDHYIRLVTEMIIADLIYIRLVSCYFSIGMYLHVPMHRSFFIFSDISMRLGENLYANCHS